MVDGEAELWSKKRKALAFNVELEQEGFLSGQSVLQSLDGFFDSTLTKPSTATTLLTLQEEFEKMQIGSNNEILDMQNTGLISSNKAKPQKAKELIDGIIDQILSAT